MASKGKTNKQDTEPKSAEETTKRLRTEKWITVECPTCNGSGMRGARQCPLCNGKKKIKVPNE